MGKYEGMGVPEGEIKRIQEKAAVLAEQHLADREKKKQLREEDDKRRGREILFTSAKTHHKKDVSRTERSRRTRTVH